MNDGYPPLQLPLPDRRERRKEKRLPVPLPPEVFARRAEIAQILGARVSELSRRLRSMTDAQRKAVFFKLEHDVPVQLSGTGLKAIAEPAEGVTLAVAKDDSLERLGEKVSQFADVLAFAGVPRNHWLGYLRDISEAEPIERLSLELRDIYDTLIKQDWVICEIELLSLLDGNKKRLAELETYLAELKTAFASGIHGHLFEHELALPSCKAVIRCTGAFFQKLVEDPFWIERIRWFEPRPKFQTFSETLAEFSISKLAAITPPSEDAAVVCIVDSGVSIGNPFLAPVTRTELLLSYLEEKPDNPSDEHGHGSAVASLAAYYALKIAPGSTNEGKVWVAGARILNEHNQLEDRRLFSKVLRDVVRDFSRLGVRIFCLAVGDESKRWNVQTKRGLSRKSWVARTIDQLTYEYDVVFVTCTGNIAMAELASMIQSTGDYPRHFLDQEARILDPGQAALALTVGSIARGTQIIASPNLPIALPHQPSPFTRCGPGIRGDSKPELVEYGGNLAFDPGLNRPLENHGLKVVAASHQLTPPMSHQCGTSFAAPRVAHRLAMVQKDLESLLVAKPSAPLLKAFLVNSASYPMQGDDDPRTAFDEVDRTLWLNICGYGVPNDIRATDGDDHSVVLFYDGEIEPDQVLFFDVPVPRELVDGTAGHRITVTVCHHPEVQRWGLERYMAVDLKWRLFRGNVDRDAVVKAMSGEVTQSDEDVPEDDESQDSEQSSMPSEVKYKLGISCRSKGTTQHDIHEWKRHQAEFSVSHYTLAIASYKRWTRKAANSKLAVVIRIEDLGRTVPVYTPVQQLLAEVEARVGGT